MVDRQCRYCVNLAVGDFCYCKAKEQTRPEDACKRRIGCKLFDFCPIDAFGTFDFDKGKYNRKPPYEQLTLDI